MKLSRLLAVYLSIFILCFTSWTHVLADGPAEVEKKSGGDCVDKNCAADAYHNADSDGMRASAKQEPEVVKQALIDALRGGAEKKEDDSDLGRQRFQVLTEAINTAFKDHGEDFVKMREAFRAALDEAIKTKDQDADIIYDALLKYFENQGNLFQHLGPVIEARKLSVVGLKEKEDKTPADNEEYAKRNQYYSDLLGIRTEDVYPLFKSFYEAKKDDKFDPEKQAKILADYLGGRFKKQKEDVVTKLSAYPQTKVDKDFRDAMKFAAGWAQDFEKPKETIEGVEEEKQEYFRDLHEKFNDVFYAEEGSVRKNSEMFWDLVEKAKAGDLKSKKDLLEKYKSTLTPFINTLLDAKENGSPEEQSKAKEMLEELSLAIGEWDEGKNTFSIKIDKGIEKEDRYEPIVLFDVKDHEGEELDDAKKQKHLVENIYQKMKDYNVNSDGPKFFDFNVTPGPKTTEYEEPEVEATEPEDHDSTNTPGETPTGSPPTKPNDVPEETPPADDQAGSEDQGVWSGAVAGIAGAGDSAEGRAMAFINWLHSNQNIELGILMVDKVNWTEPELSRSERIKRLVGYLGSRFANDINTSVTIYESTIKSTLNSNLPNSEKLSKLLTEIESGYYNSSGNRSEVFTVLRSNEMSNREKQDYFLKNWKVEEPEKPVPALDFLIWYLLGEEPKTGSPPPPGDG